VKTLGIIIPFYNEEKTVNKMVNIIMEMDSGEYEKYLYLINDCSTDSTRNKIKKIKDNYKRITLINNEINIGQNESLKKSIKFIEKHDVYLTLDGDNQHPVNNIYELLRVLESEKLDFFHGRKIKETGGDNIFRKIASKIAAIILAMIYWDRNINSTNFFLFNEKVKKIIKELKTKNSLSVEILHKHKYLKISYFRYTVNERLDGFSKYSFSKRLILLIGLISDRYKN